MFGFVDEEDFKIIIFNKEFPINTRDEKRVFAFEMLHLIERLKSENMHYRKIVENIHYMSNQKEFPNALQTA